MGCSFPSALPALFGLALIGAAWTFDLKMLPDHDVKHWNQKYPSAVAANHPARDARPMAFRLAEPAPVLTTSGHHGPK